MSDAVIQVENLGKRYTLHHASQRAPALLRDRIAGLFRRRDPASSADAQEDFWALRDVSFGVQPGEVVGVIGRNGAGKSTLLKILSRITEPSKGRVVIRGRVASLLEVGTGFHPELTGRENIFLNGAILGMNREEIRRKFDEIVAFAEVERFLDTPVKHYSSGMYVRLAFAVAAHLEPEILIVDEVLAVGDAAFQKKCLGRIGTISRSGASVLLVSHNMASVNILCSRAVLLHQGSVMFDGATQEATDRYLNAAGKAGGEAVWTDPASAPGNERVRLHRVRIWQKDPDQVAADVDITHEVVIQIQYWNLQPGERYYTALWLANGAGTVVLASSNHASVSQTPDDWYGQSHPAGLYSSECRLPANFLNEGRYSVTAIVGRGTSDTQIQEEWVVSFTANDMGAMRREYSGNWIGVVRPKLPWQTRQVSTPSS
jgi:lipopolysaccharide transport system ATP-binding protein